MMEARNRAESTKTAPFQIITKKGDCLKSQSLLRKFKKFFSDDHNY